MTVRISVETVTLADIKVGFPDLRWNRLGLSDDSMPSLNPAPDAIGLAELPDSMFKALLAGLPATPGVYAWSIEAEGGRGDDAHRAVLYLGLAAGRRGLAGRLGDEIGWIRNARARSLRWRQRWYAGHPRVMLRSDARLHYATVSPSQPRNDDTAVGAGEQARDTERALLHFARFAAGSVPPVNGSGWWSTGIRHDQAREIAWAAVRANPTLLLPSGPGDEEGGAELADPPRTASRTAR